MTKKSKTTAPEHHEHGNDKSISPQPLRKRDRFLKLFRSANPEVHTMPLAAQPEAAIYYTDAVSIKAGDNNSSASSSLDISISGAGTRPTCEKAKARFNVFSSNVTRPAVKVVAPKVGARIDNTPQLALCGRLLPKSPALSPSKDSSPEINSLQIKETSQDALVDDANREWVQAIEKNAIEQSHVRWLLERMVEEFVKDAVKGSAVVSEIILLGPVLDYEHYRKLLSCFINEFEKAVILDVDLLDGLVQLVQCASEGYLNADDLIKILNIIRTRLQQTNQQSTKHPYHLTLALSRLLDVMAKHEVKDLDRVEQHEPLGEVLSSLRESSDPYLMYQASYAFQALQCVPDNETVLQAVMRHSGVVAEGLVGISGVINLNVSGFLEGLGQLQKTIFETIGIAKTAIEGAQSLVDSGKGVFEAIREGVSSGNKRAWYPAIIGASALVREGRLADFKTVVMEAPCRQSPEFQWGICQLLGELAMDSTWENAIRRDAVSFLTELHINDPDWGRDASVKTWILTILRIMSENTDQSIRGPAATLLQDMNTVDADQFVKPYPLRSRLLVLEVSPLLARVQEIPPVERDLNLLKGQRLRSHNQQVYIPPQAKASLQASDEETKPLMDVVNEFLNSDQQVLLVLGDSGAGKSTFHRHLENELWKKYTVGDPIPLFINLPAVTENIRDIIGEQLRTHKFADAKIKELKEHREMVLICDAYDETQLKVNLHTVNKFNQDELSNTKMIISCRSTYLGQDYRIQFQPQQIDRYSGAAASLYTEAVIVPFSSDQIADYVNQFVRDPEVHKLMDKSRVWSAEEYMSKLRSIPNMMDLVKNPFLLSLALRALPRVIKDSVDLAQVKVTRLTLYNSFTDQWLEINGYRLMNITLSPEAAKARHDLHGDEFSPSATEFLKSLAAAIFKEQDGNPVVQYTPITDKKTWKFNFFGSEPRTVLLRESCPLSRAGNQHRFMHRSLLEYFYSRHIYEAHSLLSEGIQDITTRPLSQRNLVKEPSIIDFLVEHVQSDQAFRQHLHRIVELSKTDGTASQAAANAITTLVRAGITFIGADLRGIRIPGADLSGGQFDSAQFQGADLSNTNMRSIWLRQADLSEAQMAGAQFGEWPYLIEEHEVEGCAYSPDGKAFAVGPSNGAISVYETATWEKRYTLIGHNECVTSVVFSPHGRQIASGSGDKTVRLWDAQTGAPSAILSGHDDSVTSVVFSPNGQQIASGSEDGTVTLWDAKTGAPGATLSGHSDKVTSVVFSPNGLQIASGSEDETVQLWDAQTGEPVATLGGHDLPVTSVVFSPDGLQIASGSYDETVRLQNAQTGVLVAILKGHTLGVTSVVFSPSGLTIASCSGDNTVRLWDAQTGAPGAILSGHTSRVSSVVFSPDGLQIASGSYDGTVRLWDAQTSAPGAILSGHTSYVSSVAFSPNGLQIASGSYDSTVRFWDAQTGAPGAILSGHTDRVNSVAYSPNGLLIVSGGDDNMVELWDVQTGASVATLYGHRDWVNSVAFSPNGQQIASGSKDQTVRLWDAQTGAPGAILSDSENTSHVNSVVFSPNGQQIASGGWDNKVRLWDAQTGAPGAILSGQQISPVSSVVFSPNGVQIASGSDDNTMRLWDVESGLCLTVVKDFNGAVTSIDWIANGSDNYLATGCTDKSVRVWKVIGDCLLVYLQWSSGHCHLALSDAKSSNVKGLSRKSAVLLEQRGASGSPNMLDSTVDDI